MRTRSDVLGKAYVHYKSWQETYKGMIDPDYLRSRTLAKCEQIANEEQDGVLIAKERNRVIGFVRYGAYRDDTLPGAGEIYAIYLLEEYHDRGIGCTMMKEALKALSAYRTVAMWVLAENKRAIKFCEHRGFALDGTNAIVMLGSPMLERRMILLR